MALFSHFLFTKPFYPYVFPFGIIFCLYPPTVYPCFLIGRNLAICYDICVIFKFFIYGKDDQRSIHERIIRDARRSKKDSHHGVGQAC